MNYKRTGMKINTQNTKVMLKSLRREQCFAIGREILEVVLMEGSQHRFEKKTEITRIRLGCRKSWQVFSNKKMVVNHYP